MAQKSFLEVSKKYRLSDTVYPFAEATLRYRQRFATSLIPFLVAGFLYVGATYLYQATNASFFGGLAKLLWLVFGATVAIVSAYAAMIVATLLGRSRLFERDAMKNDRLAKQIKKDILSLMALDSKLQPLMDKAMEAENDSSDGKTPKELTEVEKKRLFAKELIEDMTVLVNTRENEDHRIIKSVMIILDRGEDSDIEQSIHELAFGSKKDDGDTFIGEQAERVTGLKFGVPMPYHSGDRIYIQGLKDEGYDPYFYGDELEKLRLRKKNAEITHSFPYRQGTLSVRGTDRGLTDNTEKNRQNRKLAEKWAKEQIPKIQQILSENHIGGEYNPKGFELHKKWVQLRFVGAKSFTVKDNSFFETLKRVGDLIDQECDVQGTILEKKTAELSVFLAVPAGKNYKGSENGIDYTQHDTLEEIFREIYG